MTLTPGLRKFALTAHVISSVGWVGSVACFLALAIAGLTSQDGQMVRGTYQSMDLITRYIIVPLCLTSMLTGLVQSFITKWGLFHHYWILIKFLITIISTIGLLVHMQPISYMATVTAESISSSINHRLQIQLVATSGAALFALIVATTLSVYKPKGMTPYGWRKYYGQRRVSQQ
jgi:hypothetical protein